ncbi:ABC transporter substrate-binding protein [Spirochaetia bacterium]|nr:ABC transporter substrate-binding protein [Spirochaetia bacterium]GHU34276.1 ABC transporter substrate-binding protein [Spirochaetia bacterium]
MKKLLTLALVLVIGIGSVFANGQGATGADGAQLTSLPRNQTLYFNGLLWGSPTHFNPFNVDSSFGLTPFTPLSRQLIYECLFVYNLLDAKLYPQIADSYQWNGQNVTIKLNPNVKFNNGQALTADDVVYSYELQNRYQTSGTAYWSYIDSVRRIDNLTVEIRGKASNFNPKMIETSLVALYIVPRSVWTEIEKTNPPPTGIVQYPNWVPIGTGPYKPYVYDDTKAVLIRDDNYWGQHSSRYGKLPAPKYVAHNVYKDNASGDAAFRAGEVDVSQQFMASVWTFQNAETYIPQAPYYFPGVIPMIVFNTQKPGLNDPAVRKAIAMGLDYDMIGKNAMSGYTAQLTPSLMLPVPAEQALIDAAALTQYQWTGVDIAGANRLLDQAGWVRGADGIRAKAGVRLSFRAECPAGWSDWNASLEVVAQVGRSLGMDISTYFPEANVWQADKDTGNFDIIMHSYGGAGPASPWSRAYEAMSSTDIPRVGLPNRIGNFGRWTNDEANRIIAQLASETNDATIKQLWTRLNVIYLQEMPVAGLMYRPVVFHTTNSNVWTGFPKFNDGSNIPPTICSDGYGIRALYNISPKR